MTLNKILKFNLNFNWHKVILINKANYLIISSRIQIYLIYFKNQNKSPSMEVSNLKWASCREKINKSQLTSLILIKNLRTSKIFYKFKKLGLQFKKISIKHKINNLVLFIRRMYYLRFQLKTWTANSFFRFKHVHTHKWDL